LSEYQQPEASNSQEDATRRAAELIARALGEVQRAAGSSLSTTDQEAMLASQSALLHIAQRLEQQLTEDKTQRAVLADQLTTLAVSLDRLGNHLQGLSTLLADLLERLAEPAPLHIGAGTPAAEPEPIAPPPVTQPPPLTPSEPVFPAGGEGVTLSISGVPGFQALMDLQKALIALDSVDGASVERFQEGDSRILLHLRSPLTANQLTDNLRNTTGQAIIIEESRPELLRLRLKIVS
jgi:hypothetical protein